MRHFEEVQSNSTYFEHWVYDNNFEVMLQCDVMTLNKNGT